MLKISFAKAARIFNEKGDKKMWEISLNSSFKYNCSEVIADFLLNVHRFKNLKSCLKPC